MSSPASRAVVFEARAASDAVVVGGNTLRRDNPRLTTRRDSGHLPVRVVMSRTLDLPDAANLWDTQVGVGTLAGAIMTWFCLDGGVHMTAATCLCVWLSAA